MSIGGSFTGASQLEGLLNVLADPAKFAAKLQELKDAEAKATETIILAGKAQEIVTIRAQIEGLLKQANDKLTNAEVQALHITEAAQEEAASIVEAARATADHLKADADLVSRLAAENHQKVAAELEALRGGQRDLATARVNLATEQRELSLAQQTLSADRAALEKSVGNFKRAQEIAQAALSGE